VYTAGCQTGCTTRFDNLNEQWLFVQHGSQTVLTTGWVFVYTIQPVVKRVVEPLDSRLYRVNGVLEFPIIYTKQQYHLIFISTKELTPEAVTTNCIIILSIMIYEGIFSLHQL